MPSAIFRTTSTPWRLEPKRGTSKRLTAELARPGNSAISVSFESLARPLPMPQHLDAFVAAFLPALLRAKSGVHVAAH